jgi:hypothetical protein
MASQDIHYNVQQITAFNGATINTDTTTAGNIIDTQFYEAIEFTIQTNAWTTGNITPLLTEGDDPALTDGVAVDAAFLLGSYADAVLNAANESSRIGYVGKKRYVRLSLVSAGSANLYASSMAILGHPHTAPTDSNITG